MLKQLLALAGNSQLFLSGSFSIQIFVKTVQICDNKLLTHDPDLGLPVRIRDGQEQAGESAGPASDAFAGLSSLAAGAQLPKRLGNCLYDASGTGSYQRVQIHGDAGWLKSKFRGIQV